MKEDIVEEIVIPDGVTAKYEKLNFIVSGPKGELKRHFFNNRINVELDTGIVRLKSKAATKRELKLILTYVSHLNNMVKGVTEPWTYSLKICSSHFPMNVKLNKNVFTVQNFLGEKTPRSFKIPENVKVTIAGTDITIESTDIERAGNVASRIELLTAIKNRDLRIFQDGIYIVRKAKQK